MSSAIQDATSGALGAVVSTLCTYPLDVAKTRLQAQSAGLPDASSSPRRNSEPAAISDPADTFSKQVSEKQITMMVSGFLPYRGTLDCLRRIVAEEGFLRLYVGLRPKCFAAASTNFVFFYILRVVRPLLKQVPLLQGICAGIGVQLVILPIDMVVTRLQSARIKMVGAGQVFRDIIRESGVLGFWSGLGPGLSLTLNPGITELILSWLTKGGRSSSAARAFWTAAVAKAIAGFATYPLVRAKVQLQVQGMVAGGVKSKNALQFLLQLILEKGVVSVYDGLAPQLASSVVKEAILEGARAKIAAFVAYVFLNLKRKR